MGGVGRESVPLPPFISGLTNVLIFITGFPKGSQPFPKGSRSGQPNSNRKRPNQSAKHTKRVDRWRKAFTSEHDRPSDLCPGCGYFAVVSGTHRADCTAVVTHVPVAEGSP